MIARFCTYAVLRNLRFFDPFIVLFFLHDVGLSYTATAALLSFQKILSGVLEVPMGVVNDRFGRRRGLILSFALAAVAFALFATATSLVVLYCAQVVYGVAEALRSGTHKAMILDWLQQQGRKDEKIRVLSIARFFSKSSAGAAALAAGIIVYFSGGFSGLFWAAIPPTLAGCFLLASYPASLEGRSGRKIEHVARRSAFAQARALLNPAVLALMLPSIAFESQTKLAMAYLQPLFSDGLLVADLPVIGGLGALVMGGYAFVQGNLAGVSSFMARRLPDLFGGARNANRAVHWLSTASMALVAVGIWLGQLWVGLVFLMALAALQNARRPVFVAVFDEVMDPDHRATLLSIEAQGRAFLYAATAMVTGLIADQWGLAPVFCCLALVMALFSATSKRPLTRT